MTNKSKNTNVIKFEDMPDVLNVCEVSITLQCSEYFVRKLIKENLVEECINEHDKRNKKISLTEKGKEYTSITSEISASLLQKFYNGFSDEEKIQFATFLERIKNNFTN